MRKYDEYLKAEVKGIYRVVFRDKYLSRLNIFVRPVYVILLACPEWGDLVLPIYINEPEAMSIQMALEGFKPQRPLTHDLILSMLESLGITIEKVTVDGVISGVYVATIVLRDDRKSKPEYKYIDARPSDSIALAVRAGAPIYVARHLVEYTVPADQFDYEENESTSEEDSLYEE